MKRLGYLLLVCSVLAFILLPAMAWARPRSGGSFSGRSGFRSGGGSSFSRSSPSGGYGRSGYGRGGPNIVVFPSFGWGFLPFGWGGGGGSPFGSLLTLGLLGLGAVMVFRAVRRARGGGGGGVLGMFDRGDPQGDDDEAEVRPGRAFVYKVQLGLGRSARGIQQRLESFAAEGDTASEAGLAQLLSQTSLELLREKDSIRYGAVEAAGPLSLTNGETKLNALALAERSRFQVERMRGADGKVRRSQTSAARTDEVLEYLVVTTIVATRAQLARIDKLTSPEDLDAVLGELGGVSPDALLGLEVIWTPADPEDAMTENELVMTYPHMRAL
jgi:uncharacterized membrane protein